MIQIERFINELMKSNCYILWDDDSHRCVVIDPASEKSENEIAFIDKRSLILDYIFLTHEHTDHNWGVNAILERFSESKLVCHKICAEALAIESSIYFRLYYDNPNYTYTIEMVDILLTDNITRWSWDGKEIVFEYTPGHSMGSVCIVVGNMIFSGDTIMPYKPYINKRNGSRDCYDKSITYMNNKYKGKGFIIQPGHGEKFCF